MTTGFLVIVGYWGIGIERCWKRLFERSGFTWKSNVGRFFEPFSKANDWFFDLKPVVPCFGIDQGYHHVFCRQRELLPEYVISNRRALRRTASRSPYHRGSSRRFLDDY